MSDVQLQRLLQKVSDAGACGDLIVDGAESLSLKASGGTLEEQAVRSSRIIGLRVIRDGRVGTAYSEATDDAALDTLLEHALINASYAEPDDYQRILESAQQLSTDDALLAPEDDTAIGDKVDFALALEAQLLAQPHVQSVPYNGVISSLATRAVLSTSGLQAQSRARSALAYAYALAARGDTNAMAGTGQASRRFGDLSAEAIVSRAASDCAALLDGVPIATAHRDVIFDTDQQSELFDVFKLALSGKSAKDGVNPWRDSVGAVVADARLRLCDRPLLSEGLGYQRFDVEGTPCEDIALIADGQLQTLLHNSATARYFQTRSTGHGSRDPKSSLAVAPHQLVVEAGDGDERTLYDGEVLLITDLTGTHSGANPISGDFSFGASGYLLRDGERVQSVRGVTIAGNFYNMLKNIRCIGDTPRWNWQRSALMAPLRFAEVAVSGS
jgi:PmbA protein